jgi:hypothetical protein
MKKAGTIQFGEEVSGFAFPVLNEREIRAAAGIMFLTLFVAFMMILFKNDYLMVKYVIVVFFGDFVLRVIVSPRFSFMLIIGRMAVSQQTPEYVSAPPKHFAWKIGLALSGLMFILLVVMNSASVITLSSCFICLLFLFLESSFGICLGCLFYGFFYRHKDLHCAGDICEVKGKDAIQKTSSLQLLIVVISIASIATAIILFRDRLAVPPGNLKDLVTAIKGFK